MRTSYAIFSALSIALGSAVAAGQQPEKPEYAKESNQDFKGRPKDMSELYLTGPARAADLLPPKADYAQEYFHSFKGNAERPAGWALHGTEAEECVRFQADGLRLTPRSWGVGTRCGFGVKGDFEITLAFEILKEPTAQEAGAPATRLSIVIWKATPRENAATINLSVGGKDGLNFVSWQSVWNEEMRRTVPQINSFPTQARSGKLRLVRFGPHLYFGFTEGLDGDFKYRAQYDFGPEDLREVRIVAVPEDETVSFDARVLEVRIRANGLPTPPAGAQAKTDVATARETPKARSRGWLKAAVLLSLLLAVALGGWLYLRLARRAEKESQPVQQRDAP
jgi:hypothetical protein